VEIQLRWHEPVENCVLWEFSGFIGVVDYLPYMNDSIQQAMLHADTNWFVLLNMGYTMPFPNRSFALVARPLIGAPPNLKSVVIVSQNPLTRLLVNQTLGNEPLLQNRLHVVSSCEAGFDIINTYHE
jgi:hypothetical protein